MRASQSTTHLMGGVSERPPEMRTPGQLVEQVNALTHATRGLIKRPPTEHVAQLHPGPASINTLYVHEADKDLDEKFKVIVLNDTVHVFNAVTGEEYPVTVQAGAASYLVGGEYRMVTTGNTTVIANNNIVVGTLAKTAPTREPEALVYVRQGDYSTFYRVRVGDLEATYITPDGLSPQARNAIDTAAIAKSLYDLLVTDMGTTASQWYLALHGSTIHIRRKDGQDFTVEVSDGLADKALYSVKRTVQRFEDLPLRAPDGYVVQVIGDPGNNKDDYYVVYDISESTELQGVWRECVEPGSRTALDPTTMPHQLVLKGEYMGRTKAGAPLEGLLYSREGSWEFITGGFDTGSPPEEGAEPVVRDPLSDALLHLHDEWVAATAPAGIGPDGSTTVSFSVDTSLCAPGVVARVIILRNDYQVAVRDYEAGVTKRERIWVKAVTSDDLVTVKLQYSTGVTPEVHRQAVVNVYNANTTGEQVGTNHPRLPGLTHRILTSVILCLPPAMVFPKGMTITVYSASSKTASKSLLVSYTVPASNPGSVVAVGLAAAISGNGGYTAVAGPNDGEVTVTKGGDSVGWVSLGEVWNRNVMCHLPGANMVVNEHAGRVCRNITDGSSAVILSNSADVVTVAGLTQGGDNRFDKDDMIVIVGDGTYFIFGPVPWREREVGGLTVNPFPSFVGHTISEVFLYQNRLGLVSGDRVVLSAAGDLLNFFRQTATDLRSDDVIDATVALSVSTNFHSAIEWNGGMYLLSDNAAVQMSGDPMVTPTTIRFDLLGAYPNTKHVRPAPAGQSVFLPRSKAAGVQIMELRLVDGTPQGFEVTREVPSYINGRPLCLAADEPLGILAVVTDASPGNQLYIFVWKDGERGREVSSWSRWEFPTGTINAAITVIEGYLWIVSIRSDGVYLDKLNLDSVIDRF